MPPQPAGILPGAGAALLRACASAAPPAGAACSSALHAALTGGAGAARLRQACGRALRSRLGAGAPRAPQPTHSNGAGGGGRAPQGRAPPTTRGAPGPGQGQQQQQQHAWQPSRLSQAWGPRLPGRPAPAGAPSGATRAPWPLRPQQPSLPFALRPLLPPRPAGAAGGAARRAAAGGGAARGYSAAAAAWYPHPPATLAGAAEAAAAGWGGLMAWASEGMWAAQAAILNALNMAGSHLPKGLALLLADWVNNGPLAAGARGEAAAQWSYVVEPPPAPSHAAAAAAAARAPAWRRAVSAAGAAAAAAASGAAFAARLAWLALVFAPAALTAPFALHWGWRRAEWFDLLRWTLEAAGVSGRAQSDVLMDASGFRSHLQSWHGLAAASKSGTHHHTSHRPAARRAARFLCAKQPAWVKWGQWSATRHDLFPPDMCSALEVLHAAAPAHAFAQTDAAIQRAFGMPAADVFEWLEEAPLASGSIGQVRLHMLVCMCAALCRFLAPRLV